MVGLMLDLSCPGTGVGSRAVLLSAAPKPGGSSVDVASPQSDPVSTACQLFPVWHATNNLPARSVAGGWARVHILWGVDSHGGSDVVWPTAGADSACLGGAVAWVRRG